MEGKLYLALHDGIAAISPDGEELQRTHLDGALALCVGEKHVFVADRTGAIWRFEKETLMPQTLCCGGPGICALCLSPDGERLYALLGEGDSVLMCDAMSCRPLSLNRCGCNPKELTLSGKWLAAAGGESCRVHLYCAGALDCIGEIGMPGPVQSAALCDGVVYALCLAPDMSTLLVRAQGEKRIMLRLCGMPGCLCVMGDCVFAATYGWLYTFSREGVRMLAKHPAPGRADRIIALHERLILHDPLSENLYVSQGNGVWIRLCSGVSDAALC